METFEDVMERLFSSLASGKSWKAVNRLDLFKVLFDDRQRKIETLIGDLNEAKGIMRSFYLPNGGKIDGENIRLLGALLKKLEG